MQLESLVSSSTNSLPARIGSKESAKLAAESAFANRSSLELDAVPHATPADQQGRRRLDNTYLIKRQRIVADPNQPRRDFDEADMEQLVASIRTRGIKQPITVRWDAEAAHYRVIDGGRRFEAASRLNLDEVPCWIQNVQGRDVLIDQVVHNWQRVDLKPLETAAALARLRDEFGMTQQELAETTGKPKSEISKLLAIHMHVAEPVKSLAESESDDGATLTKRHLYNLAKLPAAEQMEYATRVQQEKLSALETEQLIADKQRKKSVKVKRVGIAARQRHYTTSLAEVIVTFRKTNFTEADVRTVFNEVLISLSTTDRQAEDHFESSEILSQ